MVCHRWNQQTCVANECGNLHEANLLKSTKCFLFLSEEFIGQGGDWEDVPSQKTQVVPGVLFLVLTENVNI